MKRFLIPLRWATATKHRFIWIFGVLVFGGSMALWTLQDTLPRFPPILVVGFVLLWLMAGYVWGWLMWYCTRLIRRQQIWRAQGRNK